MRRPYQFSLNLLICLSLILQTFLPAYALAENSASFPATIAISTNITAHPIVNPPLDTTNEPSKMPSDWHTQLQARQNNDDHKANQISSIFPQFPAISPSKTLNRSPSAVGPLDNLSAIVQWKLEPKTNDQINIAFPSVIEEDALAVPDEPGIEHDLVETQAKLETDIHTEEVIAKSLSTDTPSQLQNTLSVVDNFEPALASMSAQAQSSGWAVGNLIGLNCGTKIYDGPEMTVHTVVPEDNWTVMIIGGPRLVGGQTWWDTSRAAAGDPSGGTGWVAQEQSEAASCGGGGPTINWAVGEIIGLCMGTEIRHGPALAIHTVVPENDWLVKIIDGPRTYNGQTWWDTSRKDAGDPSGGTGWVSQQQTELACSGGGNLDIFLGPEPLSEFLRALYRIFGAKLWQVIGLAGDPVNVTTGSLTHSVTDFRLPGKAGFDLVWERRYYGNDERDGVFGVGWSSLLDTSLRIANDGSVDVRYPDGHGVYFVLDGDTYKPGQNGIFDTLTYSDDDDTFTLTTVKLMVYHFDGKGHLTEMRDRNGNTIQFAYNGDQITSITDSGGRVLTLTYAGSHVASVTDSLSRTFHYAYQDGNLVAVTDGNGGIEKFEYSGHRMTAITDPAGIRFLQNIYDGDNRIVEQIDATGSHLYFDYDIGNRRTTYRDNLGNITIYNYDELSRITSITDALNQTEHFVYDTAYNLIRQTDKRGFEYKFTYDERGNQLTSTDPLNQSKSYAYNSTNDLISSKDELNRVTAYEYDGAGNLLKTTYPDNSTVQATYDSHGQMLTKRDENGHVSKYTYDSSGNLTHVANALSHTTIYTYDAVGRQTSVTDANSHKADFVYDGNNNLLRLVDPKGQTTRFEYDRNDNLVRMTDRRGGVTTYEYDANLKLIQETDAEGKSTSYDYDAMYNRISMTDARGNVTKYSYDAIYQLTKLIDALNNETTFAYDANGNVLSVRDALSQTTEYQYDQLNRLIKITDALRGETKFTFDAVGNRLSESNPNQAKAIHTYDQRGRLIKTTDALSGTWQSTYDAVGNLLNLTDANQHIRTFEYDAANRLISENDSEGHKLSYGYDNVNNRTTITDARNYVTKLTYDKNDNLETSTDALDGVTSFTYDKEDTLLAITDPSGHKTIYTYDKVSRLLSVTDGENHKTTFAYDANGNQIALTNANNHTWRMTYDALNHQIQQSDPLSQTQQMSYDALGRLVQSTDENNVITGFSYDALDRVVKRTQNVQSIVVTAQASALSNVETKYSYDAVGNLLSETDGNGNKTSYQYDLLGRRTRMENAEAEVTIYAYDAVGNLTNITNPRNFKTQFIYNKDNQLIEMKDALVQSTHYSYDANHNRVDILDANGVIKHSEYDALNRLTTEIRNYRPGIAADAKTNVSTHYSYFADSLLKSTTDPNGNVTTYAHDGAHRLLTVTDALNGATKFEYDAVGNQSAITDANQHRIAYTYDALNRRNMMTDPEGHREIYSYDAVGNLVKLVNGRGYATLFDYNNLYNQTKITDAKNGTLNHTYDALGNLLSTQDQNEHTQLFAYDKVYRLLKHTDAENHATSFEYDDNGNRIALADGNNHRTTYGYDELDRLISTTNAEAEKTQYRYDPVGNLKNLIEADGVVTRYGYDPLYRLSTVVLNDKPVALPNHETNVHYNYAYDANGNLTTIVDPLTRATNFQYDALNRMVKEINPLGRVWQYGYDLVGNLASRLDANGDLTHYNYTADNLLAAIKYPDDTGIIYSYDANHNQVGMVDEIGTSSWKFDELDRMTQATDAHNRTISYSYDAVGNRTALTYPDGRVVNYSYFANDWLKTATAPGNQLTEYQRDGVGLATQIKNSNNTIATQSYDKANRLLNVVNRQLGDKPKTISSFQYTLDDLGNRTQTVAEYGWRKPSTVTTSYRYDPLRRLVRSSTNEGDWTEYDFDAVGNRLALRSNDDAMSARPFDKQNLVYSYNDANQLLNVLDETSYKGGPAQDRIYKVANTLRALRNEVTAQTDKHITQQSAFALLDKIDSLLGQLYSSSAPDASATKTALDEIAKQIDVYAASGLLDDGGLYKSLKAKTDKASAANSKPASMGDLQATLFLYDANGNRVSKEFSGPQGPQVQGTSYDYNFENRLVSAQNYQGQSNQQLLSLGQENPALTNGSNNIFLPLVSNNSSGDDGAIPLPQVDRAETRMDYDGLFRRLSKSYDPKTGTGGVKTTDYLFDGLDPLAEYSKWNGQYSNFYRGEQNRMFTMQRITPDNLPPQMLWYAHDGLGSVTGLTKFDGQSIHDYRYTDYGLVAPVGGNWTEPHNHYTYTGQEWDNETSLLHFYARDYDPLNGVWMQQDAYRGQIKEPVTLHRSSFVGNNPINRAEHYGYWFGADDLVYAGVGGTIGAAVNVGTLYVGDVGNNLMAGKGIASLVPTTSLKEYGIQAASGFVGGAVEGWICGNTAGLGCAIGGGAAGGAASQVTENWLRGEDPLKDVLLSATAGVIAGGLNQALVSKNIVGRKPEYFWSALTGKHGQQDWIEGIFGKAFSETAEQVYSENNPTYSQIDFLASTFLKSNGVSGHKKGEASGSEILNKFSLEHSPEAGASAQLRPLEVSDQ